MMQFNQTEPLPGSAYAAWRKAGKEWAENSYTATKGALLVASVAFVTDERGPRREIMKRAFIEGAKSTGRV